MGGHPWWYIVDYDSDPASALSQLRDREFRAGRYNPAMMFPPFPIRPETSAPGPRHGSIDEAREEAAEDGTRSILDIDTIAAEPAFGAAAPLDPEILVDLYGTDRPTREQVEEDCEFLERIEERGQGYYFALYEGDKPRYILFAGYSFD